MSPNLFSRLLARPERFERPTPWFVAKYSIQLSYGRLAMFERDIIPSRFAPLKHYLHCLSWPGLMFCSGMPDGIGRRALRDWIRV